MSLFLVNTQRAEEGGSARGGFWVFQPELRVEAVDQRPVFVRQRLERGRGHLDKARRMEGQAMAMLYRTNVLSECMRPAPAPVVINWLDAQDPQRRHLRISSAPCSATGGWPRR